MTALDAGDEKLLDSILAEHDSPDHAAALARPRALDADALGDGAAGADAAPNGLVHSFDVTPTATDGRARGGGGSQSNDWDDDSDDESPCEDGPIRVLPASGGGELRFASFAAAAMSNRVGDGSTIYLPEGPHDWPGGDLRHSVRGAGEATVIQGNEGCGYFFYVRRNDVSITGCTLRGVNRGRAHIYVDEIANIRVENVTFRAPFTYNMCVQVLSSHQVRVRNCHFHDAAHAAVHVAKSSTHVIVSQSYFYGTCNLSRLVAFENAMDAEARDNVLRSGKTGAFNVVSNGSTNIATSANTVDWQWEDES